MAMTHAQIVAQDERRRKVATLYVQRVPKWEIAKEVKCSKQTITRDVKWLIDKWNKELVKDPVAERARTLAAMQELEMIAAKKYDDTKQMGWWDRWLIAVQAIATFLGLDAPIQIDAHLDGDVNFTIEFETPERPRIIDVGTDVDHAYETFSLEEGWEDGDENIRRI